MRNIMLKIIVSLVMVCFVTTAFIGIARAGTICSNGQCFTCDGSASCVNGVCTCNGMRVQGGNLSVRAAACGGQPTAPHSNGGGVVAMTAKVEASVFVSNNSTVCGNASVSGSTRMVNGSLVNGSSSVSGQSVLDASTVNGATKVSNSSLINSTL